MSSAEERDGRAAAAAAASGGMSSLEMESGAEETESLVSGGGPSSSGGVTARKGRSDASSSSGGGGMFAALQDRNQNFSARNLFLIAGLAGLVFLFVRDVDSAVFSKFWRGGSGGGGAAEDSPPGRGNPDGDFHSGTFGGINNLGHPAGAKAYTDGEFEYEEIFVPVSNVGHAVPSLGPENVLNFMGHYIHDEHRSPYASHLYDRPLAELAEEQKKFEEKMKKVREKWGAWDFKDDYKQKNGQDRPLADFTDAPYKDLPAADFPEGTWQADPEYVKNFLVEAKALVTRVREGIFAEYGQPTVKEDGSKLTDEEIADRDKRFGFTDKPGDEYKQGIAGWIHPNAFEALVKKLTHSMMTNDEFYVVMGGHSAAAGHGNNFRQAKMMAFHYLMEPIFDKLGMRLVTRSMAQGGVGTTHSAFASGSIYGEKDMIWWDSSMTEGNPGAHDIFSKQAILGGERVPVLMSVPPVNIVKDTNGTAWVGHTLGGQWTPGGMVPFTTKDEAHAMTLPFAVRYMFCTKETGQLCNQNKYNSICWEPRSDFTPSAKQAAHPGSQVKWHPGVRVHHQLGRIMSLLVLKALDAAIDKWQDLTKDGSRLPEEHWHVGETYRNMQEALRTTISSGGESACEKLFHMFPRVCRVAMHGFGEWTPRRNPAETSLLSIMKAAPDGYLPHPKKETEYAGIDVMPLNQRVPDGDVDVHAIAIASTAPAPDLDHSLSGEGERRRLTIASREAARFRTERAREVHRRRRRALREDDDGERDPSSSASVSTSGAVRGRSLADEGEDEVIPGRGWTWDGGQHFCDGSYQSECGREKGNTCMITGHNDARGGFTGGGRSGWFVFTAPKVKEGLILLRIEWWAGGPSNWRTEKWTEENDGRTREAEPKYVFPDLAPKVNATTPFLKWKELKDAEAAADADTPAAPAPAPAPTPTPTNETANPNAAATSNATRSVRRARRARRTSAHAGWGWHPFGDRSDGERRTTGLGGWEYFDYKEEEEEEEDSARWLKGSLPPLPEDTKFDIAINGKIVKTMDKEEFMSHGTEIVKNFAIWPIMDDPEWAKRDWGDRDGEDVEVGVRLRQPTTTKCIKISHVFYA